MEKVLWEGRLSVKSFYDMTFCSNLLIAVSILTLLFLDLPGIEVFALLGLLAGESITNVVVRQDVVGRMFGFGNVRADTAGTAHMGISFIGIEDPYRCAEIIRKAIENAKKH